MLTNEMLTNDVVNFEQPAPVVDQTVEIYAFVVRICIKKVFS